ncbi:MAG: ATP-binding protein [Oscillospiraceae bacterium]|nr:ATP-binding protein [Oscillospiraceae bacterium]
MKYNENVYLRAENTITSRRLNAQAIHEQRIYELSEKYPELRKVNDKISNALSEMIDAIELKRDNTKELIEKIGESNLTAQNQRKQLLVGFGYDADYLDTPYTCRKCKDTGYIEGIRCECFEELLRKYAVEELNNDCAITLKDFDDFSLDYYSGSDKERMARILTMCRNYAENFSKSSSSLLFIGNTGLGKTLLSSAIAKSVFSKGFSVAFDSITGFLRKIEAEHFGRSNENTLNLLTTADLVILDDLGSEFSSSFTQSAIYDILNTRISRELPTIISTNYSFTELREKYNERIISRIDGEYIHLNFCGSDIRRIKKNSI